MGSIFRAMKIFSIAALACAVQGLNMQLDEDVPCDNFGGKFDKIKNMKPKCTANKGPVQKKYRCNLQCTNGNTNVWSVRPIKCKVKNANSDKNPKYDSSKPTEYKWKPNQIKGADTLCDDKEECDNVRSIYNLTKDKFDLTLYVTITQTRTVEKFSKWFHTQQTQPLVLVTTTNHQTYDASGPRSRNLLSDVSVPIDQKVKMTITTIPICMNMTCTTIKISNISEGNYLFM